MNSHCQKLALPSFSLLLSPGGVQSLEPFVHPQALMVGGVSPEETEGDILEKVDIFAHPDCDARQLVRLIQCPHCSKPFTNPVTLPCGHTVCRACLPDPKPRTNISYPNTPDRLLGVACPLSQCGAEHAAAECNVDVTLTKLMELVQHGINEHRRTSKYGLLLEEVLRERDDGSRMEEKDVSSEDMPHSRVLHGGRLASTFTMMELGELRYSSGLTYRPLSESGDDSREDMVLVERLRGIVHKELDCLVCYNMMLDPTTTGCGHTFCRRCLERVMDHSSICPVCRRGLNIPASLENKGSNILLNSLLDVLCPDLVVARKRAVEAEERVGNNDLEMPLFICTLSLPTMPTFLHIFEPRYRLMMRRCMDGNRLFGMVMYNKTMAPQGDLGPTQFLEYGTLLEIVNYELLRDGRSFVETRGVGRFKVRAHGMLDGYNVGRIDRIEDVSLAEEGGYEQRETRAAQELAEELRRDAPDAPLPGPVVVNLLSTQELLDNCMAFVREMRQASAPWLSNRIVQVYGEPPDDPAIFPYWFGSVLPIAEEEKYVLLRTSRVRERLKIVYSWISRIRGQRWPPGNSCSIL